MKLDNNLSIAIDHYFNTVNLFLKKKSKSLGWMLIFYIRF